MPRYRLTTWYYVLGVDDALHAVPARVPEELLLGSESKAGPPHPEWVHDFGGVILVGAVLALRMRRPVGFVGMGVGLLTVTPDCPRSLPLEHWARLNLAERVARTAGHRAHVRHDRVGALGEFLLFHNMNLPVVVARTHAGMGLRSVLYMWNSAVSEGRWDVWEIATGQIVPGTRE